MRDPSRLSPRELGLTKRFSLPLRAGHKWLVHRVAPPIGEYDTHVTSRDFRRLSGSKPRAILMGTRIGLACLMRFTHEIRSSGYPFAWILRCEMEDSWFLEARTPPEILFYSGTAATVRRYIGDMLEHCIHVDSRYLVPPALRLDGLSAYWTVQPPVSIDERYFVQAWSSSPALDDYLSRNAIPLSREYHCVLKRCFHALGEIAMRKRTRSDNGP